MTTSPGRTAFLIHLAAYVAVNGGLLVLNALQTLEPGAAREWWAVWPLIGWGIGLAAHGLAEWTRQNAREGRLLADPDIRGVAVHLFVYLAVNALLIGVNLTKSPDTLWFIWPLLGWGLGFAAHAWLAYRAVLHKTVERYATEQRILTEIQLERQAAEIAAAVGQPDKPAKKKTPARAKRRKQAAAKPKKKTAARRGAVPKRAPAKKPNTAKAKKPAR
jgi:hypothetical protein